MPIKVRCPTCRGKAWIISRRTEGGRLRLVRQNARLTIKTIARALGVTPSYLCMVEHGRRAVTDGLFDDYLKAVQELEG